MAQLQKPEPISGLKIDEICPPGQYVAVCLDVQDLFGVTRRKFQSQETETKDVTRFVFGVLDQQGRPYLVQTYEFTIASTPGSNLIKFLTSWLGRTPDYGWDYCELRHTGAMLAIMNRESKGVPPTVYSTISGIFPVPAQLLAHVPNPQQFAAQMARAGGSPSNPAKPVDAPQVTIAPQVAAPQAAVVPAAAQVPGWNPEADTDDIPF